jgi:hypothetical protein
MELYLSQKLRGAWSRKWDLYDLSDCAGLLHHNGSVGEKKRLFDGMGYQ